MGFFGGQGEGGMGRAQTSHLPYLAILTPAPFLVLASSLKSFFDYEILSNFA